MSEQQTQEEEHRWDKLRAARRKAQEAALPAPRELPQTRTQPRSKRDPARRKAQDALWWAVRSGRLVRPEACSVCGRQGRVEGHHADYGQALEVQWLCRGCHSKVGQ